MSPCKSCVGYVAFFIVQHIFDQISPYLQDVSCFPVYDYIEPLLSSGFCQLFPLYRVTWRCTHQKCFTFHPFNNNMSLETAHKALNLVQLAGSEVFLVVYLIQ